MIDFMSHLLESMLCKAISRSPGVSGETVELPSPENRHTAVSLEPFMSIKALSSADGHL